MQREKVIFAALREAQGDRSVTDAKNPFELSLLQHYLVLFFWCHARALCIISVNRLNRYAASWGPGEASGWYWTENIGMSRQRRPSTASSFRLAWLTCTGPYERKIPSGLSANAASAVVEAGTTVTSQPSSTRRRKILYLIPKSKATTLKRPSLFPLQEEALPPHTPLSSVQRYAVEQVTSRTRSRPMMLGACRAFCTARSASGSRCEIHPCWEPWSRRCVVSARVSIPWMPTMP